MTDRLRIALTEVSTAASAFSESTTDYDELLKAITRSCARALKATCTLGLFDETGVMITPVAVFDDDPRVVEVFAPMLAKPRRYDESIVGQLSPSTGNAFLPAFDLATLGPRIAPDTFRFLSDIEVSGLITITMRVRGENFGILTVLQHDRSRPPLDDFDREIATHLKNLAGFALANARLFQRAQQELAGRLSAEQVSERLRESEARAVEANLFLDAVLENIPAMVFVKDAARLSFVRFNRAGEELLGIPRMEMIGKTDLDFFPPSEAEFFVAKDRETLRNQQMVDIPEEPIQTASGERWLHTRKVPVIDERGEPRYLVGISHDITDRKRDMAALERARDHAEGAKSELEAFSYSVAHDLRTPLRAIDGFSQALLEDFADQLGETGQGYLNRVRGAAQRMAMLIDDLLKLSRVTRAQVHRETVDLGELFRTTVAALQRCEPEREVELVATGDLVTRADPKLVAIAFDNLIGNAWKFTSRERVARIALTAEDRAGERVYCLADNGVGFDMAYSHKLFGVFNRLHADQEFPGTGVGLATVHRIISRHGGRVWGKGEIGEGATFFFTLGDTRSP